MPTKQLFTALSLAECRYNLLYEFPTAGQPINIYPRVTKYLVPYLVLYNDYQFDLYLIYPVPEGERVPPNWSGIHGQLEETAEGTIVHISVKAPFIYFVDVVLEELVEVTQPVKFISKIFGLAYKSFEKLHLSSFKQYNVFLLLLEKILEIQQESKWVYQPLFGANNKPSFATVKSLDYSVLAFINQQAIEIPRFNPLLEEIYHQLGDEIGPNQCQIHKCAHKTISHSLFCRAHHMEQLLGQQGLFYFQAQEIRYKNVRRSK